jgi:hypothetical protein
LRWVQHYTPEFEKRWKRLARPVGGYWRMDETYIKVRGTWVYLYRAIDKQGFTVDFYLSPKRDGGSGQTVLAKDNGERTRVDENHTVTYAASHRALTELKEKGELPKRVHTPTSKIEQDHRRVSIRFEPWWGEVFPRGGRDDQRDRVDGEDQEGARQAICLRVIPASPLLSKTDRACAPDNSLPTDCWIIVSSPSFPSDTSAKYTSHC